MTNQQIAKIFYNISKMLEIKGENRFRTIAYENAARTINKMPEDIVGIYKQGGVKALDKIRNIGEGIAKKIEELIKTGKMRYYNNLQKTVPLAQVELMEVPGIGPQTAKVLYKELKIKNIKELANAAKQGKISKLDRFDVKTEKNILKGISQLKKFTKERKRMLLPVAFPIADEAISYLKKNKEVKKCDIVGSLRRMRETIGDIDIIVGTKEPKNITEYFSKAPFVKRVIAKGDTKCSIIHKKGARIDIEVLGLENYTSLLQHFTGSKEHNVALRTMAKDKGFSISEYGIKNTKTKKLYKPQNEKAFYNYFKMQYIPPEMRENNGEIEAALRKKIPRLIEFKDIKGDLHVHSLKTDGTMSYDEVAQEGIKRGYEYINISDHTKGLGVTKGLSEKQLLKAIAEIRRTNKKYKRIKLLAGCEVNITSKGELDIADKVLAKLDVVVASIHSAFTQPENKITKRLISAIKNPNVDIIGHPSGRIIGGRDGYEVNWPEVFEAAAKYKTALEINAYPDRLDLRDVLIKEAKNYGVMFAIDTDSHQASHLDNLKYGVGIARRGWVEKKDVINTKSYNELVKWLKNR